MLLAGVETTGAFLAWLLRELDRHPGIRTRLLPQTGSADSFSTDQSGRPAARPGNGPSPSTMRRPATAGALSMRHREPG